MTAAARVAGIAAASVTLLVAGCSLPLPQAQHDPTKVYVLSATGDHVATAAAKAPVVRLRPVEVASYLRVRPLIVRRGENEIEFREFARWGEPLEQGIARVLREELLASGAAGVVEGGGSRLSSGTEPAFEISVRVLTAEGGADGAVRFDAVWEVAPTSGDAAANTRRGEFRATDVKWTPKHEGTLAAGLSRAVAALAEQIAGALR